MGVTAPSLTRKGVGLRCNHGHLSRWVVTGDSTLNVSRVGEACLRKEILIFFFNEFNHFTDNYMLTLIVCFAEKTGTENNRVLAEVSQHSHNTAEGRKSGFWSPTVLS